MGGARLNAVCSHLFNVPVQQVVVLVDETHDAVRHLAGVMKQAEVAPLQSPAGFLIRQLLSVIQLESD